MNQKSTFWLLEVRGYEERLTWFERGRVLRGSLGEFSDTLNLGQNAC